GDSFARRRVTSRLTDFEKVAIVKKHCETANRSRCGSLALVDESRSRWTVSISRRVSNAQGSNFPVSAKADAAESTAARQTARLFIVIILVGEKGGRIARPPGENSSCRRNGCPR